jgi:hypothetical protein
MLITCYVMVLALQTYRNYKFLLILISGKKYMYNNCHSSKIMLPLSP